MRKKLLLFLTAICVANFAFSFELSNPGFESSGDWWNFQVNELAAGTVDYTSDNAKSGSQACHIAVTAVSEKNWHVQLNVPNNWTAVSGNTYTVSFFAKADVDVAIHVAAQDGAPNYGYRTGSDASLEADADWKKITFEYIADKDGDGAVNFNIYVGNAIGNYYFDDFELTETQAVELDEFAAPPVVGAFESGEYRNLFTEAGKSQEAVDNKVEAAFNHFFYGNNDNERVYYQVEEDLAYIADLHSGDIRSEGMSYGMMICVQLNKKFEFDCLWNFAKTYMQHQDGARKGYFSWSVDPATRTMNDPNSASDGEEYFATALFFASHRWGDGDGIYDYSTEANQLLYDMLHLEERNGGKVDGLTNMFDAEEKKVVFVPEGSNADFTDPSYHLPAFYKLWAEWAEQDNDFWLAVADTSKQFLQRAMHETSGLTTDYMTFDAKPYDASFYDKSAYFSSDSYRVAMNVAMDCSWWGYEEWHSKKLDTLLNFLSRQGSSYQSQYEHDGTVLTEGNWEAGGFYAMNGVAPLGATTQASWDYINKLWSMSIPAGQYRYYDGMLYMLAMLNASGEYKIWKPGDDVNNPTPQTPDEIVVFDPYNFEPTPGSTSGNTQLTTDVAEAANYLNVFVANAGTELVVEASGELSAIKLYTNTGKCVMNVTVENASSVVLPIDHIQAGLYFAQIIGEENSAIVKVVK